MKSSLKVGFIWMLCYLFIYCGCSAYTPPFESNTLTDEYDSNDVNSVEKHLVKVGDYITLGKYNGEMILWRCVAEDENGQLFLSDKNLCYRSFDSIGEVDKIETKGSHTKNVLRQTERARWSDEIQDWYNLYGSNYWGDSNIRSWLNSSENEGSVKWLCGCPPRGETERKEKGFLHRDNFTNSEKTVIKTVYLKNYLDGADKDKAVGGINTSGTDYNNSIYEILQENMFLLDLDQIAAIEKICEIKSYLVLDEGWWLKTPYIGYRLINKDDYLSMLSLFVQNASSRISFNYKNIETEIDYEESNYSKGIRPAFYLNEENAQIISGSGTKEDPYVLDGKPVPERFEENGLYGYKDANGNVIVPAKYLKAWEFSEGAALVVLPEDPYRLRYIDTTGNYLFDKAFYASNNFNNGYALVLVADDPKYSYINKTGELATELLFDDAEDFCGGYARVQIDGKWGVVDTNFSFKVPCEYDNKDEVLGKLDLS